MNDPFLKDLIQEISKAIPDPGVACAREVFVVRMSRFQVWRWRWYWRLLEFGLIPPARIP